MMAVKCVIAGKNGGLGTDEEVIFPILLEQWGESFSLFLCISSTHTCIVYIHKRQKKRRKQN